MFDYGYWHDYYWHSDALFNIILLVLVLFGVVYFVQNFLKSSPDGPKKQDTAIDTLKKRYASGEIDAEEFAKKKKDLES